MDSLTIGISIYAAILSTILVVIRVLEYQRGLTSSLLVEAYVKPPFDCLNISVTNNGTRPVTVAALTLRYGNQKLANYPQARKLEESDCWSTHISRRQLEKARHHVEQRYFSRLLVDVRTTTRKRFSTVAYIPTGIIEGEFYQPAGPYIATDLLLGFPRMESH